MEISKLIKLMSILAKYYPEIAELLKRMISDLQMTKLEPKKMQHHDECCLECLNCLNEQQTALLVALEHNVHMYCRLCGIDCNDV